jgi:Zn ribbon nucleic-acid-binding protein
MALDITCPSCGESDDLSGERADELITVTCGVCGHAWSRSVTWACPNRGVIRTQG